MSGIMEFGRSVFGERACGATASGNGAFGKITNII